MRAMAGDLAGRLGGSRGTDRVLRGAGKRYEITRDGFREIAAGGDLRRMAFVDGGNAVISESPVFVAAVNRVYYALFRGAEKLRPRAANRLQFLSYVLAGAAGSSGGGTAEYAVRLFPYGDAGGLPREDDMAASTDRIEQFMEGEAGSLARRFAELSVAARVARDELGKGDMLVLDGSLRDRLKGEKKYADDLYRAAADRGVVVCGLAKTSRLVTESGDPLLARILEISEGAALPPAWYIRVAEKISPGGRGFVMAVKLHPRSRFLFRFEILREQYEQMGEAEISSVLHSLAANSGDASMPGYPYGLIDADRFAKVRSGEIPAFRAELGARASSDRSLSRILRYEAMQSAHDWLNRVT